MMAEFEIYQDARGEWRWRFRAANGEIVAVSSEGYVNRGDCEYAINLTRAADRAPVREI